MTDLRHPGGMPDGDDFAGLLRSFRTRLAPEVADIPVPPFSHRRSPGLRREELAERADVSIDHIRRLEQRRRHPSRGVVNALARALRLSEAEHDRLCSAAGCASAVHRAGRVPRQITPAARRLLDRLIDVPVAVCDAAWTVLAGNAVGRSSGCGAAAGTERDRNMAWRVFTEAPTSVFRSPGCAAAFRQSLVIDLRAADRRYDDPYLQALIADLGVVSAEFATLWRSVDAVVQDGVDRLYAPRQDGGADRLERDTLTVDGDLRLVVFTRPSGSSTWRLDETAPLCRAARHA